MAMHKVAPMSYNTPVAQRPLPCVLVDPAREMFVWATSFVSLQLSGFTGWLEALCISRATLRLQVVHHGK